MKRLFLGAVMAAGICMGAACKGDPTAATREGTGMLSLTPTDILADPGTAVALVVVARDAQLNPIQATVTASSANTAVATIEPDTSRIFPDGATYAFLVHVVGVSGD